MKLLKKAAALVLVLAFSACSGTATVFAEQNEAETQTESAVCSRGVFRYRPGLGISSDSTERSDYYVYSDEYFREPSAEYNVHLATMSMAVCEASASAAADQANQSRNLAALLEDIGFSDFDVNDDYRTTPTVNTAAVACAHKQLTDGGKSYTLLAVVPRSSGYGAELGNSILFGTKGNAEGFGAASSKALSFTREYIAANGITGDIKLWLVGYDRGAAVAELAAMSVIDDPEGSLTSAVSLLPENLYAYTFGTPCAADAKQNPAAEKYGMIFNHISDTDLLSALPPSDMGFDRCGTVKIINSSENKKRMKQLLAVCNRSVYNDYVGGNSPEFFSPKRLSSSLSVVSDPESYIPGDAAEYLNGMSGYLTRFSGGRAGFAADAEKPLSLLLTHFGALSGDRQDAFTESIEESKDTINAIFSLYAYFMKLKSTGKALTSTQVQGKAKELAALGADGSEFTEKELYQMLLRLARYKASSADTILNDAANYLKSVLTDAMKASGATSAQISALTTTKNMKSLARFLAYLSFGNCWQSSEADTYNIYDNEQIKNAVTLLDNYERLMSDHRSEVQMSWLRTGDEHYSDYAALTEAQLTGYRRVYLTTSDGAAVSGEIVNSAGERVAELSDGVLVNSSDAWLGYTSTDGGGFLRIPAGEDYRIVLSADSEYTLGVTIGEYDCGSAQATSVLSQDNAVPDGAVVTVELPAFAPAAAIPSGAEYTVTVAGLPEPAVILGDANGDGVVDVTDVTAIQKHLAGLPTERFIEKAADIGNDGLDITDATKIQKYLAGFSDPYNIGSKIE